MQISTYSNTTTSHAWINGFLGVLIFSGSLPATKAAIGSFEPLFLTAARASIAGVLALIIVVITHNKRPSLRQLYSLSVVAFGVVLGFPLFTALALQSISSAHSIIFLALLPLSTAIFAVIRGGERPNLAFWCFSLLGSLLVLGYALSQNTSHSLVGNGFMLLAIIVCGLGYAEGAVLTKQLGGVQVICWALIVSLPCMLVLSAIYMPINYIQVDAMGWAGLFYVSLFSMLIGFIFWYRGLAQGGAAAVGQLQLLQPFFALILSAVVLHEAINPWMIVVTLGVVLCVIGSKKYAK